MKNEKSNNLIIKVVAIGLVSVFANVGLAACSRTPGSSNNTEVPSEIKVVDVSNDEISNAVITGGWKTAEDQTVTTEQKAVFDKAMEKLVGVKYEPVAYLASQVVSGMNHCFLCKATIVRPGATPHYALVYIYESLKNECKILDIKDIAIPGTKDGNKPLGGFAFAEDPAITPEISSALDKATATKLGATYEPVANIGSQVINGINYVVLCKVTGVAPGAATNYAIVQIRETIDGECTITDVTDIVISASK